MDLSNVDWEMVKNISVLITSLAALVGIYFGVRGINEWRREHVGKRRIDLAEEVLALFYEARDVISAARGNFGYQGEGSTRQRGDNETSEQSAVLDEAFVVIERLRSRQELFSRLHALRYRFMAQNGTKATKPFTDLSQVKNRLVVASRTLGRFRLRQDRQLLSDEQRNRLEERVQEQEAIFWEDMGDTDPISPEVDRFVAEIEKTCKTIISGK